MNNANPNFMASYLGHSLEEFFKTYAKWINRMNNSQQLDFIEKGIQGNEVNEARSSHEKKSCHNCNSDLNKQFSKLISILSDICLLAQFSH